VAQHHRIQPATTGNPLTTTCRTGLSPTHRKGWADQRLLHAHIPTTKINRLQNAHPTAHRWIESKHPRVRMHFTPTSGSWLNLVEVFFGIITRQAIRRGTFTSAKDLIGAIETFIDAWNDRCQPFVWTKTADEILTKANRKVTSNTRH
jgi:hypothetical protein